MSDFPDFLAQKILNSDTDPGDHLIILPTRRGAAYVQNRLTKRMEKAGWMPQFTTLSQWIGELSGLNVADELELKFTCYQAYKFVMKNRAQSFSEFFSWVDILIRDFNEIESQLIPRMPFFKELTDYSEIEHFSFLELPLTEKQENYRSFWRALPDIQEKLNDLLLKQNLAYSGLMTRRAVKKIREQGLDFDGKLIVAGLNTLSNGEASLLKWVQEEKNAEILFDADAYYLDNPVNQAGHFIRQNLKNNLGEAVLTPKPLHQRPLEIEICEAGQRIDQAQIVVGLLSEMSQAERKKTAVVLADEQLLIPILDKLPPEIEKPNITMGIGLADSTISSWLDLIFELAARRIPTEDSFLLPSEYLERFKAHPFTYLICNTTEEWLTLSPGYTAMENLKKAAAKTAWPWLDALLHFWSGEASSRLADLKTLCAQISTVLENANRWSVDKLQAREGISLILRSIQKIESLKLGADLSLDNFKNIVFRAISGGKVNSIGDPLDDMQIMGLLETRPLSFERIIVCGVNEEALPGSNNLESFIPFEIRRYHQMPGRREKAAVYAYNFFRLIQHAESVNLVYDSDRSSFSGGEMSRYIRQIEFELQAENSLLNLRKRYLVDRSEARFPEEPLIKKTPDIISRIEEHLKRGLSVSSINTFLADKVEWFYKYIVRAEEPEVSEVDVAGFGSAVHKALEDLYAPFKGKIINSEIIDEMSKLAAGELRKALTEQFPGARFDSGVNKLHLETGILMISNYLKSEKALLDAGDEVVFVDMEKKLERILPVTVDGGEIEVKIKGFVDKIERRNGVLEIIDYKTGKVEPRDVKDLDPSEIHEDKLKNSNKTLQLLTYNWLASQAYDTDRITAHILTLTAPHRRNFSIAFREETNAAFENFISEVVQEMLDPEQDFTKNPEFKYSTFE